MKYYNCLNSKWYNWYSYFSQMSPDSFCLIFFSEREWYRFKFFNEKQESKKNITSVTLMGDIHV